MQEGVSRNRRRGLNFKGGFIIHDMDLKRGNNASKLGPHLLWITL